MPHYRYSVFGLDPDRTAIASGRNIRVSPKTTREVCHTIKGMTLEAAQDYLKDVQEKKRSVPFRRHRKKVGHRSDLVGWDAGRYPVKSATRVLEVLENAENNAIFKGLDTSRLRVIHACIHRGTKLKRIFPRAMGRSSPKIMTLTHIEIVLQED